MDIQKGKFIENGRRVMLRGVNLGGSTKMPIGGETHKSTDFLEPISFVGRPFPLKEADEHFQRLQNWGFNTLRLLTIWEAIEHAGPGKFDTAYLDYFKTITKIADEYGFYIFIDPHQDVWSRMTGGDGAPAWLFEKVGLDYRKFAPADAALTMQYHYPEYPPMSWIANYRRFATSTMFTLFFGGKEYAPNLQIDGLNVQEYMQQHFIDSMLEIAKRVKDYEHVLGFDSLNEPNAGYIGIQQLDAIPNLVMPGLVFTPHDGMKAAKGYAVDAMEYKVKITGIKPYKKVILNPNAVHVWQGEDVWETHRVIDKKGNLLKSDYFARKNGHKVDFFPDFLQPFIEAYTKQVREINSNWMMFIEGDPLDSRINWRDAIPSRFVNATHWYDGVTLITKRFQTLVSIDMDTIRPVFFKKKILQMFRKQLQKIANASAQLNLPTVIGEFGIPFDMHGKAAYKTGNFKKQLKALALNYDLMDEQLFNTTLWNYTADNSNQWGDLWNLEDFSIFSRDQQPVDDGARALLAFNRPYVRYTAGKLIKQKFKYNLKHPKKSIFTFQYDSLKGETVVYLPKSYFQNPRITANTDFTHNIKNQLLTITTQNEEQINIRITNA